MPTGEKSPHEVTFRPGFSQKGNLLADYALKLDKRYPRDADMTRLFARPKCGYACREDKDAVHTRSSLGTPLYPPSAIEEVWEEVEVAHSS